MTQSHISAAQPAPHLNTKPVTFLGRVVKGMPAPSLEGCLQIPPDGAAHPGVVLAHASPSAGGTMDMKVMLALESELARQGMATLRYNSRGTGGSGGEISRTADGRLVAPEGEPETEDIGAALDFLAAQEGVDAMRLALVGHSFGSRISLAYLASHFEEERVGAVVCIGLPVAWRSLDHLGQWTRPKLFITGEHDDFSPPGELADYVDDLPEPSTLVTLKQTGHFFEGREHNMAAVVAEFLKRVL